jgi:uncharacterized protein with HEPN domain
MYKDEHAYLKEMLRLVSNVHAFIADVTEDAFMSDQKTQAAVLLEVIMLGELAKKISEDIKKEIDVPWHEIAALRNRAVHDYTSLDADILRSVAYEEVEEIQEKVETYLAQHAT